MSGYEGRADVVCQGLSGPFLARLGHEWSSQNQPRNRYLYDMLTPSFLGMLSLANAMHWLLYANNS
jgi:hypothetical protein